MIVVHGRDARASKTFFGFKPTSDNSAWITIESFQETA
jgi:hypothetical protein